MLDTYTLFANADGEAKPEEFPDLLHPNEAGYAKWRVALLPLFATLGFSRRTRIHSGSKRALSRCSTVAISTAGASGRRPKQTWLPLRIGKRDDPNMPPWPIIDKPVSFDGKTESPDGRFRAINGRLVVTTPTEGRRIQQLYTTREFPDDFTLKLEFRATPNADSGVYLRGPQLQCRDYPLAGPYKDLKGYKPQDWNELVVTVRGNKAHCTCNGEVIEEAYKLPDTGPIGVEGDRGQMEYRRIRLRKDSH